MAARGALTKQILFLRHVVTCATGSAVLQTASHVFQIPASHRTLPHSAVHAGLLFRAQ
jgi:hypothetical protein